jgi:gliding motility-associated-like protein
VSLTPTSASCFGSSTGSITSNATGGTPAYTYTWSPGGQTTANVSGLATGTYTVSVRDNLGCTQTASATVTQPTTLTVNVTPTAETCDYSNNGSALATPSGGTAPFTYSWAPGGQTTQTATGLAAGNYTVTVTDVQGCVKTATTTVTQPAPVSATFGSQTNVSCNGGSNASVTASGTGGTPNYTYTWMPGSMSGAAVSGLSAGIYTVTVLDAHACTGQATVSITQPAAALSVSTSPTNVSCFSGANGSITATPTGGTSPYTYLWATGGQTTQTVNSLVAGTYTVTVTDNKGCTATSTNTVTQPTAISVSLTSTSASCFGSSTGSINSTVSGGTPAYTYSWTPGGQTTANVSGLAAGSYTVQVRDNLNCLQTASLTVTQPTTVTVNVTPTAESCDYSNNGSALATPSGGTAPFTYSWAPGGQTTQTATGLAAGNYTVTVTDALGCVKTASTTVTQPATLSATFGSQSNVSCNGGNNGSVTASGTGGTPNYTYTWMPGAMSGATVNGLSTGTYTVTVIDAHACTGQGTVTITQPASPLSVTTSPTNVSCFGGANGSITANPTGGTAPYTYSWATGGQTTQTVNGLVAGTYTVTVTDNKGCTATATRTLTQPTALSVSLAGTSASCFGSSTGSINSTVSGGTPTYTYSWTPGGQTTANVSGLAAGSYTVQVTDNLSCTQTASVTVTQPTTVTVNVTPTAESCDYSNNGSAIANPAGGTAPYTYAWAPGGQTTQTATALTAGNYTVTVTDALGCVKTASTTVTQPATLSATFGSQSNVSCNGGNNGSVTASGTGGTPNYTYTWMPGAMSGATVNGLSTGTYTVTVIDAHACTGQGTVTITQPASPLSVTTSPTNVSCFGGNNGSITANPTGGTAPYTYSWAPGGQTTQTINSLTAGSYTVTVTDNKGCVTTVTRTITQPAILAVSLAGTNASCFGSSTGSINSTVTGGTAAYTYSWTPGGQTTANVSGLAAGSYTVQVTDNLSCTQTASLTITQPATVTVNVTPTAETCDYSNNGSAIANPAGGTAPYTYVWAPGGQTTQTATALTAGNYTVTVTDNKGCIKAVTTTVTQPATLSATFGSQTNVNCNGGTDGAVTAVGTGGTPNYTYAWMPGAMSGASVTGLGSGTYTVTVTDSHACTGSGIVTITQPTLALGVSTTSTNVSCFGGNNGSITANPTGGTTPYTYSWAPGGQNTQTVNSLTAGTYTVTVTDAKGCTSTATRTITEPAVLAVSLSSTNVSCFGGSNGSINSTVTGGTAAYSYTWAPGGQTTANVSGLTQGSYTVSVRDNQNCTQTASVTITQPTTITVVATPTAETCDYSNNGSVAASVAGGTPAYTYLWAPGGQTTATATNLTAGSYTVTVTDNKGCIKAAVATVTQPATLSASFSNQTNVSCFGGGDASVTVNGTGGTPNYTYSWMPGAMTGANVAGLSAGTYTVTVTDAHSCTGSGTVTITQPAAALSVSTSSTPASCHGGSNGTVTANGAGGTSPYASYVWQPGNLVGQSITNLAAGSYTVTVTDNKNCTASNTVNVTEPAQIVLTTSTISSTCSGVNGSASVAVSGGVPGYTYQWFPSGGTADTTTLLGSGAYTVQVTDANGCTEQQWANINDMTGPSASIFATTNVSCFGGSDGTATVGVVGGTGTLTYSWTPSGGNGPVASGLTAGTYTISVIDANGCESLATTSPPISQPTDIIIGITPSAATCFGGTNGSASAVATGGTGALSFLWLPGGTTGSTVSGLAAGVYTLQVTDGNSCSKTATYTITQPAASLAVSASATNATCFGGSNGTASSSVTGGTAPYTYTWMPGSIGGQNISNLTAGTYTINVVDSKGCPASNSATVTQPTAIAISMSSTNSTCGNANGSASASVSGGTGGYTYFWTPGGQTTSIISGVVAGAYSVAVTDANSCPASANVTINNTASPVVTVDATNNPTCFGAANGTATTSVTGGTGTITYLWTPTGGSSSIGTGLSPGIYTVTATDANGCTSQATTALVTQPTAIAVTLGTTPVSCTGGTNGTITSSVTGGTPAYTYFWLPGGMTTPNLSNQAAGTYTLQVTDANTCVKTQTVTIAQPALAPAVSVSTTSVSCFGGSNGTASSNASGGTAPYTYTWMPGSISGQNIANVTAGTYTVMVADLNGCIATNTITVTQPTAVALTTGTTNSTCGNSNGSASVNATGGTGAYTYFWTPGGQTTSTLSSVLAGGYTVQVSDANNCTATANVTINNTSGPSVTVTATNQPTCFGAGNGTASTSVAGGTGTILYNWTPSGGTASTGTGLSSGVYTVTVTDGNSCTAQATTALVTEPTDISITLSTTAVSCFGGANGTITSNVVGGTPGYNYFWLPGGSTATSINGQAAGTYTLQITDANTCVKTQTVTITQPPSVPAVSVSSTSVTCFGGSNGTASSTASGGTAPYTYTWMPGSITGQNISNLAAGTYTITVADFNGCTATNSVTVTQPTAIALTTGSTNSTCGNPNGSANVSATGGTGAYTYFWTPGGVTTSVISGVLAGAYTVQVNDANSCTATANVTINNTGGPTVTVLTTNNPSCFGSSNGTATTSLAGGTGTINYVWTPSGGTASTAVGLSSGVYTVTVTDANGCQSHDTTSTVVEPTAVFITLSTTAVNCFGGNDGTATSTVVGGTPGYTYFWLPGGSTATSITAQPAGTYTLQVTDANTCIKTETVTIAQPPSMPSVSVSSTSVLCFGGSDGTASSTASGGTAPYSYSWMPGSISGQNIANVTAGTYTVTVTDFNGCVATNTVAVAQPTAIALTTGSTNSTCGNPNGSATVNATGGTGAYTYFWTPGGVTTSAISGVLAGSYTVLVNDANNCSATANVTINNTAGPTVTVLATNNPTCFGSANGTATTSVTGGTGTINYAWTPSGGSASTGTGLSSGVYTVTVSDANGCTSQDTTSLVTEPTAVFVTLSTTPVNCFAGSDGTATSNVVGGTPGYTYSWLPGGSTATSITGQPAGTYTLQVTDANSCVKTETVSIAQPPSAVSVSVSSTNVLCFGGSDGTASSTASGGTAPYTYSWMPGAISGQNIANIAAGTYTVTVTDFNGCVATNSVTITQPTAIALTAGSTNSTCGNANGSASVNATGGTGAYTYFWSPSSQTNSTMTGVLAGTYTVLVTDANSCSDTSVVTINNTSGPVVTVTSITNVTCNGASDGTATTSVTGGTGTISYSWAPLGGTAAVGTGLAPGTYTVTATDINGCQAQDITAIITEPEAVTVNVTITPVGCFGGTSGSATAAPAGGTAPYTYVWLPVGSTGVTVNNLAAGTYTVRTTDGNGCIHDEPFSMTEPSSALAASTTTTPVSCFGGGDGTTTATASGGTAPYNYSWAPVAGNNATLTGLPAGNYTVTVTDNNSCVATSTITVSEPPVGLSATGSGASTSCSGSSDGTALVTPAGGTPNYSYSWSPAGGTAQTASGLLAGNYIVTITDSKACSTSVSLTVTEPAPLTGSLTPIDATCGLANGSITTQITGGTVPYAYVWSPGAIITPNATGLNPGTYSVIVTDVMNCTQTFTASIGTTPPVLATITSNTPVACFGGTSGAATVNVTQGTAPFTISWLPYGGTATTASGLAAGTYTATVMDAIGCTDSATTVTITEPAELNVAVDTTINVSCNGGSNASITVTPFGGTPAYTYAWSPGAQSTQTATGLGAGIYSVTVTDQNSCVRTISMPVTEPPVLSSVVSSVVNPPCTDSVGSASVVVSGGTIPYYYAWNSTPTQTGSTMLDVPAGSYTCTITDSNNCVVTNTVTITNPTPVVASVALDSVIICAGGTSSLSATATGGTGVYTYVWMSPPVQNGGTLPFSQSQTTTYTVTAYDQNNCASPPDTVVGVVYSMNQSSITATGDSLICPGHSAAVFVQLNSTNTGPLTYSWTNLAGNGPGAYVVTPNVPTTYVVTVTNSCGIVVKDSITVGFNPPPTVTLVTNSNAICAPSTIQYFDASVSGNPNDPIVSWLWNFGDGGTSTLPDPDHEYTAPGSYNISLTVTTAGGCINSNSAQPFNVQAYPFPNAAFTPNATTLNMPYDQLICTNQSTPVAGSTYQWNFGDGSTSTLLNPHHSYNSVGTYEIELITTTSHGCRDTAYAEVTTDADVVFPNVFTPNPNGGNGGGYNPFDNSNDVFYPFTAGVTDYHLQVFNRWGELIFESKDINIGWDGYYRGKICQQDVYIYKAYLKLNNGKEYDKTGDITLLQ